MDTVTLPCGCYKLIYGSEADPPRYACCAEGCAEGRRLRIAWETVRVWARGEPERDWPTERIQGPLRLAQRNYWEHFAECDPRAGLVAHQSSY